MSDQAPIDVLEGLIAAVRRSKELRASAFSLLRKTRNSSESVVSFGKLSVAAIGAGYSSRQMRSDSR
ncbi:hypothetical protein [Pseudomonas sp. NPDC096950]|uniref:hypothetical protein n=1 Tax=Pseudomonas sp. NPDC096950 TaxID=3364485 RepID=UPI00383B5A88